MSVIHPLRAPQASRAIAALAAAALVLGAVAGCGDEADDTAAPAEPATSESTATSPSDAPTTDQPTAEPVTSGVYYLVDTRTGFRLARELRDLPGDDPAQEAVEAMLAGPEDPDYATTWDPGTEVLGVTEDGGTVLVDLSEEARTANAGSEAAERMVQQLVWTVTEALGDEDAEVQLLIEGEPAGELWGVLAWDEPVGRSDALDVRLLVQIDSPREGETTSTPVRVEGEAAVFEATLLWRVLDESGAEVTSGATMTAEGQTFAPFAFPLDLDPGTYIVEISEDDPSGGEGGPVMVDTRTVTVE